MLSVTKVFIHGLESSSTGNKGVFFRKRYPEMIIENYEGTLENRMDKLERLLAEKRELVLVGSSFGGLMAALYACQAPERVRKLILLAPALDLDYFAPCSTKVLTLPVVIFHGMHDEVVPVAPVKEIISRIYPNLDYHLVDDDHSLSQTFTTFDWDRLLCV